VTAGAPEQPTAVEDQRPGDAGVPGEADAAPGARRPRPVFLVLGLVLATALGIGLFTSFGTTHTSTRPSVGSPAPAFSLPALSGSGTVGTPQDGGGNGRGAVLLFFASWCAPCQTEMPALATAYRQIHDAGGPASHVAVLGVDGSDETGAARAFVATSGIGFPVGADHSYSVTQGLYFFTGLPEAVFITASGTIAHIDYGPISPAELTTWMQRLARS
jgi:cytochrome c biogenesis protein CcmG, thiol:disulfide interchange protein DsbE